MKKIILAIILGLFLVPQVTLADGALIPRPDYYIYETEQKAAIFFRDNQESLVLSTSFYGDAKDFTWIVPTPSQPTVTKISSDFFTNLDKMTQITDSYLDKGYGLIPQKAETNMANVTVIERKSIGYYDLTILKAEDTNSLYNFLKDNNFSYPEESKYILDDYIRLGWTFTAVKINEDALQDAVIGQKLHTGDISPLKFSFATDKMVYPLKISGITRFMKQNFAATPEPTYTALSVSSEDSKLTSAKVANSMTAITLYLFADHKKDLTDDSLSTIYANWISASDINKLGTDEQGNSWVNAKSRYFLTKMTGNMSYSQMDDDLYPQNATSNNKVGVQPWYQEFLTSLKTNMIWFLLIVLALFFVPMIWQFQPSSSRTCRIVCWILQVTSLVIKLCLLAAISSHLSSIYLVNYFHVSYLPTWYDWYVTSAVTLFSYALPLGMVAILVGQIAYQQKHKQ